MTSESNLDRPWRRPGTARYACARISGIFAPPVTVTAAPADLIVDRDVAVRARDGVVLRVNIYRPRGQGPFPALLSAHPYGKDNLPKQKRGRWGFSPQYRIMRQPAPVTFSSETGWEAPDPVWWVQRGYVVVNADLRGAGTSDGVSTLMSDKEGEDVYDLIEWVGAQPWSSGRVGMIGVSYLAMSQYKAAALHPPSLKAIAPWEGFTDAYRDLFTPGGIVENGFSRIWQSALKRLTRTGEDFAEQRKLHPLRDGWWQSLVPKLQEIELPMLICASFSDNNLHSRGSFRAFQMVRSKDKFAYTHRGGKWATFYGEDARRVQLGFFDRYLKKLDVPKPPPVRLEVRERGNAVAEVRAEQEWPLARTAWRNLYLRSNGRLDEAAPQAADTVSFDTRREAAVFALTVDGDLELTGPMSARLWVSIEGDDDVCLFVGVEKWSGTTYVPFEGSYGFGRDRVTMGWQRASLRELDAAASTFWEPVHTFLNPRPLAPNEVVPVDIALGPSSTLFRAGESLRLVVAGRPLSPRNPLSGSFPASYVPGPRALCTLHWGPNMPAVLCAPVIPRPG